MMIKIDKTDNKREIAMKRLSIFFTLLLTFQFLLPVTAEAKTRIIRNQTLNLYKGQVRVLRIGEIERVAVGNGKIISTSITRKGQLIILAEKAGETIAHIWGKKGWERELKIRVSESNPRTAESEIRSLLRDAPSLSVRTVGGRIVIDGDVGPNDAAKLKAIKKYYPNVLVLARETVASFHDKMIHMKVQITEFSSNALQEVGINWQTSINGPITGFAGAPGMTNVNPVDGTFGLNANPIAGVKPFGFFGLVTAMTSKLNLLESNGDALVLASPTLIARSGGEAEFLAGGQIPLPSTSQNGTSVEFKDYGIKLKIKPIADDRGNITARVETELSAPDSSTAVNGIPGFLSRKAQADLSMKDSETIVISGLMNSSLSKDVTGVKYLRNIPLLGSLFRSRKTVDKKTELVIFVTPKVVSADSRINREGIAQHKSMIRRFRDAVELEDWMEEESANAYLLEDNQEKEPTAVPVVDDVSNEIVE